MCPKCLWLLYRVVLRLVPLVELWFGLFVLQFVFDHESLKCLQIQRYILGSIGRIVRVQGTFGLVLGVGLVVGF